MRKTGPGRPKKARKAHSFVTRRVRRLVDLAHDGNIRQAADECGLPYATLRDLYSGRRTNPGLKTLKKLAERYEIPMGWFTDERQSEEVPISGYVGYLEPRAEQRGPRPWLRDITIPFAAWEFVRVIKALDDYLESLPATPERPIVGDSAGKEGLKRLTEFLLQPILAAEAIGEPDAVVPNTAFVPDRMPTKQDEENWVRKLRLLGNLWESLIPGVLDRARKRTQGVTPVA